MHPIPTRILLLLLSFSSLAAAANFAQCLEDFRNDPSAVGGVDSRGRSTSPAAAVGLTYSTCIARCGADTESLMWNNFARSFSSWLLPWLTLICELPFGSSNYADGFAPVIVSVGSPALAAYSLVLTSLNTRSVYCRASRVSHGSRAAVAAALISLQQLPLELTQNERLFASIPISDWWRQEIGDRLSRRGSWSLATATSIVCIIIVSTFALVDSLASLGSLDSFGGSYEGHVVGTAWLCLLCLVVGWMWVPGLDSGELKTALRLANQQAVRRATKESRKAGEAAKRFINLPREGLVNRRMQGVGNRVNLGDARQEPDPNSDLGANPNGREDPNGVDRFVEGPRILQDQMDPETNQLLILKDLGSLNRDERRPSVTFNYSRTLRYLALVDDVFRTLDKLTRGRDVKRSASRVTPTLPTEKDVFPPGALPSMFHAAIMALILQCGTTIAATLVIVLTPPFGLECYSLGYVAYGTIGIVIMFLSIISTIFARISETRKESTTTKSFTAIIAIALRRISFFLALANGAGLILTSCLQFSHLLDNCYCSARVISHGPNSYIIVFYDGSIGAMRYLRFVAILISGIGIFIYMVFLRLVTMLPHRLNEN